MTRDEVEAFRRRRVEDYTLSESSSGNATNSWGESSTASSGGSHSSSLSRSDSRGTSRSRGQTRGSSLSASSGQALSQSTNRARSRGASVSLGESAAVAHSDSETFGTSSSDAYGGSESWSAENSRSEGESGSVSQSVSKGVTVAPMLMPVMGTELSSRQFRPVDEQLFNFAKLLDGLPTATVSCGWRRCAPPSPYTRGRSGSRSPRLGGWRTGHTGACWRSHSHFRWRTPCGRSRSASSRRRRG